MLCPVVFLDRHDVPPNGGEVVQAAGLAAPLAADSSQPARPTRPRNPDSSLLEGSPSARRPLRKCICTGYPL